MWHFAPLILSVIFFALSLRQGLYYSHRKKEILRTVSWFNRGQEQIYDLEGLSKYIVGFFTDLTGSRKGALFLYSRQGNRLRLSASSGVEFPEEFSPLVAGLLVSQWAHNLSHPVFQLSKLDYKAFDEAFPNLRDRLQKEGFTYVIPLIERNLLLGIITLGESNRRMRIDLIEPLLSAAGRSLESLYLYESAVTDDTTGLFNKRFFQQSLQAELRRSDRYSQPCSLIVFDIDDFKKINDTLGHPQGDRILREFADCLRDCLRGGIDIAARTGGEEFHVILPETDMDGAFKVSERIRQAVQNFKFSGFSNSGGVTISLGVATYPQHALNDTDLVSLADKALYLSKARGKNQTSRISDLSQASERDHAPADKPAISPLDSSTTLYSTDYFVLKLKEELKRSARYKMNFSLVLMEFKGSKDRPEYEVVRALSSILQYSLRMGVDIPTLLDSEHLVALIPHTNKQKTLHLVERLTAQIKDFSLVAGVVTYPDDGTTHESLMTEVFAALEKELLRSLL